MGTFITRRESTMRPIKDLNKGDSFLYNDIPYIKVDVSVFQRELEGIIPFYSNIALNLQDNCLTGFHDSVEVELIDIVITCLKYRDRQIKTK